VVCITERGKVFLKTSDEAGKIANHFVKRACFVAVLFFSA